MAKFQCRSCGGIYVDPQPDGSRYFHACSSLVEEFDRDGVLLTPDQAAALRKADQPVTRVERRRSNHRDENIDPVKVAARDPNAPASRATAAALDLSRAQGDGVDELVERDAL